MSGAVSTAARAIRRLVCGKHNVEYGQTYDPGVPGQRESVWLPPNCPECEKELRDKLLADEEVARQTAEIEAEADRRAADDTERAERIRAAVDADMAEDAGKWLAEFYATRREEYETYRENEDWNRIAEQVKSEKSAAIISRLQEE
jgi:hypothetical protein